MPGIPLYLNGGCPSSTLSRMSLSQCFHTLTSAVGCGSDCGLGRGFGPNIWWRSCSIARQRTSAWLCNSSRCSGAVHLILSAYEAACLGFPVVIRRSTSACVFGSWDRGIKEPFLIPCCNQEIHFRLCFRIVGQGNQGAVPPPGNYAPQGNTKFGSASSYRLGCSVTFTTD